jgi:cytoskeletal protein RodZ
MEKFDQPELHPRGFPLWVEILLVSALILTPLVAVSLWQAWQDSQHKDDKPASQSTVTETQTPTKPAAEAPKEKSTETPAEKPAVTPAEPASESK